MIISVAFIKLSECLSRRTQKFRQKFEYIFSINVHIASPKDRFKPVFFIIYRNYCINKKLPWGAFSLLVKLLFLYHLLFQTQAELCSRLFFRLLLPLSHTHHRSHGFLLFCLWLLCQDLCAIFCL